jgi:MFS family permease
MSAITGPYANATAGDRLARRNALVLAVTQALSGGNSAVVVATGGIVGAALAPDRALATVPITVYVLGMWIGTVPVGILARRFGRRVAFQSGALCGALTGLIGCLAVLQGSFLLFNLATFCGGLYAAAHQSYRFAAADTATEAFRPKAISWVLAGGLFAGFVGPQLIIVTKDLWPPYLFAASYLAQAAVALLAVAVLSLVDIPRPAAAVASGDGRPLGEIARQPRFMVAVVCGVASYGLMNLVMTSAPLAMIDCSHSVTDATLGLQWHIIAMYAPSFVTGSLIIRFGVERVIAAGLALLVASAVVGLSGVTVAHFWTMLILLGLGWNFGFVGATAMVTQCHRPDERNKVQAFNDFLVFGSMAVASFSSGKLLAHFGWAAVNMVIFPMVATAAGLLLWHALARSRQPA